VRGRAWITALVVATAAGSALATAGAAWGATLDPATAEADVRRAREDGIDAFCKQPERPLSRRARSLCGMAADIKDCKGFADACAAEDALKAKAKEPKTSEPWSFSKELAAIFGVVAQIAIWVLILGIIVAIAIPVVQAIARARRDKRVAEETPEPNVTVVVPELVQELETVTDAELLLRRAEEHARRGELERATVTFLHAALRALDHRGVIRIARHRTNGEYVRGCKDPDAKPPLREIVREVDAVQFGGARPTADTVARVAARAAALVRMAPTVLSAIALFLVLATAGCSAPSRGPILRTADPAGDEMMIELLKRQGMTVSRLGGSLATLPMPKPDAPSPAVIVDVERTTLEDDTRAHLLHWVEAGGVLVLVGEPSEWPASLKAKAKMGTSHEVTVSTPAWSEDEQDDDGRPERETHFEHAKIARPSALTWEAEPFELATLKSGELYAASKTVGAGVILGIANDDLLTNAALSIPGNAPALVALLAVVDRTHEFKVAKPEDGISPPTNPIAALNRAGLGLGLWHALAASLILFLAVGVRLARPKPTPPPRRRAFTEHVEATGALFARTRIAAHALAAYARYADERLRAKMPRGMSDPSAFLASRANADPAECAAIWARATAARSGDPPRGDELIILRQLSQLYSNATKSD
jgi:hypothetical protein